MRGRVRSERSMERDKEGRRERFLGQSEDR